MEDLLKCNNIIHNLTPRDEAALLGTYQTWHNVFQPVRHGFGHHFVSYITQTDRSHLGDSLRV